jgi:hypothetical protein
LTSQRHPISSPQMLHDTADEQAPPEEFGICIGSNFVSIRQV